MNNDDFLFRLELWERCLNNRTQMISASDWTDHDSAMAFINQLPDPMPSNLHARVMKRKKTRFASR